MNPKCTLPEPMRRDALLQFDRISLTWEEEQQIPVRLGHLRELFGDEQGASHA